MERIVLSKHITRALAYGAIGVMSFVLFAFFSQPNRLAHDQIDHALVSIVRDNPTTFDGDYIWGTSKRALLDNYYSLRLIEWVESGVGDEQVPDGTPVGSREITRWLLLPLMFFLATIGMFELCFAITRNLLASLGSALISNIHVPYVFVTEWGLPGPTELDPWVFVAVLYPLLLLLFYKGITRKNEWLIALSFLLAGVIGNLHLISWFNIVGVFSAAYIFYYLKYDSKRDVIPAEAGIQTSTSKTNTPFSFLFSFLDSGSKAGMTEEGESRMVILFKRLVRLVEYVLLSAIAVSPFLIRYFSSHPKVITSFNTSDLSIWQAIRQIAFHVTAEGKLGMVQQWLFSYWWFLWPLIGVFFLAWWLMREKHIDDSARDSHLFLRFGALFIATTIVFNAAFSLFNLSKLYFFHQLPEFNEPRGIQLMYPVFFVALSAVMSWIMNWFSKHISKRARVASIIAGMAVAVVAFGVLFPNMKSFSYTQTHAPYTFDSCDAELYRVLNHILAPNDVILVDPTYYGAIRVCAKHPIVVHNRDKATAYVHGADVMMEWFSRFHRVQKAFEAGGNELLETARVYGAQVIVSRQCVPVDETQLSYSQKVLHPTLGFEGCIYRVK